MLGSSFRTPSAPARYAQPGATREEDPMGDLRRGEQMQQPQIESTAPYRVGEWLRRVSIDKGDRRENE